MACSWLAPAASSTPIVINGDPDDPEPLIELSQNAAVRFDGFRYTGEMGEE
jgi:hypothetical protein